MWHRTQLTVTTRQWAARTVHSERRNPAFAISSKRTRTEAQALSTSWSPVSEFLHGQGHVLPVAGSDRHSSYTPVSGPLYRGCGLPYPVEIVAPAASSMRQAANRGACYTHVAGDGPAALRSCQALDFHAPLMLGELRLAKGAGGSAALSGVFVDALARILSHGREEREDAALDRCGQIQVGLVKHLDGRVARRDTLHDRDAYPSPAPAIFRCLLLAPLDAVAMQAKTCALKAPQAFSGPSYDYFGCIAKSRQLACDGANRRTSSHSAVRVDKAASMAGRKCPKL